MTCVGKGGLVYSAMMIVGFGLFGAGTAVADVLLPDIIPSEADVYPLIVAGDPGTSPGDSPSNRIDPNVPTSPFAGVGSIEIVLPGSGGGTLLCSGTLISETHVITAAHCFDVLNNDGIPDTVASNVKFHLNVNGNNSTITTAAELAFHPDYTGFLNPSINDDLAILTLSEPVPPGTPIYGLFTAPVSEGETFHIVGYGVPGTGTSGFNGGASYTTKRTGANNADRFGPDDEGGSDSEVFFFDFDAPEAGNWPKADGSGTVGIPENGFIGGPSLGNDVEATLGHGDSGGPSFVFSEGTYLLAGVNTFGFNSLNGFPYFGSGGGGILVPTYAPWIESVTSVPLPLSAPAGVVLLILASSCRLKWRLKRCSRQSSGASATS